MIHTVQTPSKTIRTAADLAISGAAPAFAEPIHVGRPNIGDEEAFFSAAKKIFERRWLSNNGPVVQDFERALAERLGVKYCVAICNGTVALEIAIRALGMSGEVIVPSYTFVATAHALAWMGLTPVFADIDPATHCLDPEDVARKITPRTSGILGTHLWGRPCQVEALDEVAQKHGLAVLYDAAHAFLCSHNGKMIGGFGQAEVFSFHATKFFNSFEGGAITTNDTELADKMRLMRNFGFAGYDHVVSLGTNGKMTEICAAMGLVNLDSLDAVIATNRANDAAYREAFAAIPGLSLIERTPEEVSNFQYVVLELSESFAAQRDTVVAALSAENILVRKYFWPGCHRMMPYAEQVDQPPLPHTETVADRVLVLPTGTALPEGAIRTIADILKVLASPEGAAAAEEALR